MRKLTLAVMSVAMLAAPAVAGAKTHHHHHTPCGKTKAAHTNCGKHLGKGHKKPKM